MSKMEIVYTEGSPKPIGPYNQGIIAGGFFFCSGQVPLDPKTGELVGQGDIQAQTRQVLSNMQAVLEKAGCSWSTVVKTTIFLKSMNDFAAVNEIYATVFPKNPPARSCVEVSRLPKDVGVEIECIALTEV